MRTRFIQTQLELIDYATYIVQTTNRQSPRSIKELIKSMMEPGHGRRTGPSPAQMLEVLKFLNSTTSAATPERHSSLRFRRAYYRMSNITPTDYELSDAFTLALADLRTPSFSIAYELSYGTGTVESVLRISKLTLFHEKKTILSLTFDGGTLVSVDSDFTGQKKIPNYMRDALASSLDNSRSVFNLFYETKSEKSYVLQHYLELILAASLETFSGHFSPSALSHIGPLRAHPKRFYFLDTAQPGSSEGELMIEALRENAELQQHINVWLQKFGVNITVSQFQEIIYRLSVRNKDHEFDLDITDVGFGISQILPILVEGFLSPLGRTILIEQPEIHLHPRMQAELGDLCIEVANLAEEGTQRRQLIIETHSEYLLNRLRARVAQGKLRNSDLAIHNVSRREGSAEIRGIYVPDDGSFEWPSDFLDTDLEDTLAFLSTRR